MNDRTSTKVLPNGAIRYEVFDETGVFLRYEYILLADEPTQDGMPLNKASLLKDTTAALYGLGADAVPDEVLAIIPSALKKWNLVGTYTLGGGTASISLSIPSGATQLALICTNIIGTVGSNAGIFFGGLSPTFSLTICKSGASYPPINSKGSFSAIIDDVSGNLILGSGWAPEGSQAGAGALNSVFSGASLSGTRTLTLTGGATALTLTYKVYCR